MRALGAQLIARTSSAEETGMPMRPRPNRRASVPCLGGWHIGVAAVQNEAEAIRIVHAAIDEGLTFFDDAWDYHDGASEIVMGEALASHRMDGPYHARQHGFLVE